MLAGTSFATVFCATALDVVFDAFFFRCRASAVRDFFATVARFCFLNFDSTMGRLAVATVVFASFFAVDLAAAIAGSPEKLIQIPVAAISTAKPACLARMAVPLCQSLQQWEQTGAKWPQDGRKRESCERLP